MKHVEEGWNVMFIWVHKPVPCFPDCPYNMLKTYFTTSMSSCSNHFSTQSAKLYSPTGIRSERFEPKQIRCACMQVSRMCLVVSASTPQKWHTLPHIRKQHRISKLIEEDNEKGEGRLMNKESGRAGRDELPFECLLYFRGGSVPCQTGAFLDGATPNGLFGLGMGNESVPSILAKERLTLNSFSMCFGSNGLGRITFGDNSSLGNAADLEFHAIFDSGTSFTYLNDLAYKQITNSFRDVMGKGAMKTVYRAFDKLLGIEVAWNQVKIGDVFHSPEQLQCLYSEVHLLKHLNHDSMMIFYGSWKYVNNRTFNFVTELFISDTLRDL
ncbi:hypothetical protein JHK85_032654 [Glycine max]|nr:hypothetical protein JHK85_032654 [Glycine max]KAG4995258.1 hypothetical protein JHK86_032085 [Glycine max]